MSGVTALAFAKVNLSLRVLGRRDDGYHELDTVFQTVGLADRLTVTAADVLSLEVSDPSVPSGPANLVWKAAEALRAATGFSGGAEIRLEKRIPSAGGLGGGSSDAAVTLVALARLWGLSLSSGALEDLAAALGSDVPFFLTGGTARGTGRGERIEPLPDAPPRGVLLVLPPFGASTPDVFRALGATGLTPGAPLLNLAAEDRNDLEPAAEALFPMLETMRRAVAATGALRARMSGSGSTLFGLYPDVAAAAAARVALSARDAGLPGGTRLVVTGTVGRPDYELQALGRSSGSSR